MRQTGIAIVLALASGASFAGVPGQGSWETTLQARDLDGDGSSDAFYDTALDVTWLRDASAAGRLDWQQALRWADGLVAGRYADWRLPAVVDTGTPGCSYGRDGTDCGYNVRTTAPDGSAYSELAHLYHVTLGNRSLYDTEGRPRPDYGLTNTGDFIGLQAWDYWTATELVTDPAQAWYFYTIDGAQLVTAKSATMYAIALRDGDVLPVDEPAPALLLLSGLAALGARQLRRGARGTA